MLDRSPDGQRQAPTRSQDAGHPPYRGQLIADVLQTLLAIDHVETRVLERQRGGVCVAPLGVVPGHGRSSDVEHGVVDVNADQAGEVGPGSREQRHDSGPARDIEHAAAPPGRGHIEETIGTLGKEGRHEERLVRLWAVPVEVVGLCHAARIAGRSWKRLEELFSALRSGWLSAPPAPAGSDSSPTTLGHPTACCRCPRAAR